MDQRRQRDVKKKYQNTIEVNRGNSDHIIFLAIILLTIFGVLMVYSASYYTAQTRFNSASYFAKKQLLFALIGFLTMIIMSSFDFELLKYKVPTILYSLSVITLLLAAFSPLGVEVNGARRWLEIPGIGFRFQPSDIAKATLILYIPSKISRTPKILIDNRMFMIFCGKIIFLIGLVAVGKNLSTTIILLIISFGIIFVASPFTWRFIGAGVGGVSVLLLYLVAQAKSGDGFRGGRFSAWRDPFSDSLNKGFQTIQGLYAIASGGIFGLGFGKSRQKLDFIPEAHNDIIFAVICEELGLVGATIIITLFGVIIWRGLKIAFDAPDLFSSLVAVGIIIFLAVQTIINISVVTNTIPNTGIALPFISYGGTSIIITMGLMGVLLNISRYTRIKSKI